MRFRSATRIAFLAACSLQIVARAGAQQAVPLDREPSHHLVLQNEYVRVFKVEVAPHASTQLHQHDRDYIFVTLGTSSVENDVLGKPPAKLQLQDGEARFAKGGFAHVAKNLSDKSFRNFTIELLKGGVLPHEPLSKPRREAVPLNAEADDIIRHETEFSG